MMTNKSAQVYCMQMFVNVGTNCHKKNIPNIRKNVTHLFTTVLILMTDSHSNNHKIKSLIKAIT